MHLLREYKREQAMDSNDMNNVIFRTASARIYLAWGLPSAWTDADGRKYEDPSKPTVTREKLEVAFKHIF
jgi:hypothetical protein